MSGQNRKINTADRRSSSSHEASRRKSWFEAKATADINELPTKFGGNMLGRLYRPTANVQKVAA